MTPSLALVPAFNRGIDRRRAQIAHRFLHDSGEDAFRRTLEFFAARIRNPHTRRAYAQAVTGFFGFCVRHGKSRVQDIDPVTVAAYIEGESGSPASKKVHLAAIRKLFDFLVTGQIMPTNPVHSVAGPRHQVVEGLTPAFGNDQVRQLFCSIDTTNVVGLRDRAIIATLVYTAARVGAVAKLRLRDFQLETSQWVLVFREKRAKIRKIPVRYDLQTYLDEYIASAGIAGGPKNAPLFRPAIRKTKRLKPLQDNYDALPPEDRRRDPLTAKDILRMLKRRLADAGLPTAYSCHSFRATTITDLLAHGAALEDVQYLAGHTDARTTRLYCRNKQEVTRNIVERITIESTLPEPEDSPPPPNGPTGTR